MPRINYISEARKRHTARPEPRRRPRSPSRLGPPSVKFHFPWANGPVQRPYLFPAGSSSSESDSGPSLQPEPDQIEAQGKRKRRRRDMTLEDILASDIAGIRRPKPNIPPPRLRQPAPPPKKEQHRPTWLDSPKRGGLFQLRHRRAVPNDFEPEGSEWDGRGEKRRDDRFESIGPDLDRRDTVQPKRGRSRTERAGRATRQEAVEDDRRTFVPDFDVVPAWQDRLGASCAQRAYPFGSLSPHLAQPTQVGPAAPYCQAPAFPGLSRSPLGPSPLKHPVAAQWSSSPPPHFARDWEEMPPPARYARPSAFPAPPPPPFPLHRYDPFQRAPTVDDFSPQWSSSPLPTPTPAPAPHPLAPPQHQVSSSTRLRTPTQAPRPLSRFPAQHDTSASPHTHTPSSQLSAYERAHRRAHLDSTHSGSLM